MPDRTHDAVASRCDAARVFALAVALLLATLVIPAFERRGEAADPPGDLVRGALLFEEKQCGRCHVHVGATGMGPPVEQLRRPQGAMELSGRLWNHAPAMFKALAEEKVKWPEIGVSEMADLMRYLSADSARDSPPDRVRGQALLVKKGCLKCHRFRGEGGAVATELTSYREGYQSPVDWASAIWNHSPKMAERAERLGLLYPRFAGQEMRDLYGFLKSAAKPPR